MIYGKEYIYGVINQKKTIDFDINTYIENSKKDLGAKILYVFIKYPLDLKIPEEKTNKLCHINVI